MSVTGHLSSVAIDLDLSQFSLIMGVLGENLGEQLDAFQAPLTVIVDPLEMVRDCKKSKLQFVFEPLIFS